MSGYSFLPFFFSLCHLIGIPCSRSRFLLSCHLSTIDLPQSREVEVVNGRNVSHTFNSNDDFNSERIPVLTARNEVEDSRRWKRSCPMGSKGESRPIDLKVIDPYKKVLTHAGYFHHYNSVQLTFSNVPPGMLNV